MKNVDELTILDFEQCPVWEFVPDEETEGSAIFGRPIMDLPITNAQNRFVGTKVTLNNGNRCWATIGNIDLGNRRSTHHFLTISLVQDGKWFHLARYHDFDYSTRGPDHLAKFLGLPIDGVFPISYDLSGLAVGFPEIIRGKIPVEIHDKLSKSDLIHLALE